MSTYLEYYVDCPSPTASGPVESECGASKTTTWSSPGLQTQYFFVQNLNKNLIGFTFSGITNNGSDISVDVVYARDGVLLTAQTFSLGVVVSNVTKYHFLNLGDSNQTNGLIYLKFNITGGSSGSINVFLNCNVQVASRKFCYQILKSAPRDLCTKCTNEATFYFARTSFGSTFGPSLGVFNFNNLYIDPELQILATSGYYTPTDSPNPKVIWYFTGGTPSVAHLCDPKTFGCGSQLGQDHVVATDYKFNSPYIPGVEGVTLSGLKYSTKDYFLDMNTTDWGYFTLTVSNNQTYQQEVSFTVSDANAPAGQVGLLSYTEGSVGSTEAFRIMLPQTLFTVPKNSSKTIRILMNGQQSQPIKLLRIRVSVGLKRKTTSGANITTTVSASCMNTVYSAATGLHAYSAYDSANSPKCTTNLYSTTNPASWGVNTRVWHDPYFIAPALPYFYTYGSTVFKVGYPYKREFGTKLYYELKTSTIRQIGSWLGLSKKNPTTVTPKTEGPKDWGTPTQVPSCIEPSMLGIGQIKFTYSTSSLPVPSSYLYLVGKNASSKISANDSVFGEYDWNTGQYKPITGLVHALTKVVGGYVKASTDPDIRRLIGSSWLPYAAAGLGALASAIIIAPAAFGLSLATATMTSVNVAILQTASLMCANPATLSTAGVVSSTGIGALIVILVLIILILFWPVKKKLKEDNCLMFDKVYTNNEYIENSNTIYTLSGLTSPGITGYYTDGGYFYTTSSGVVSGKEVSYTNVNGAREYSVTPDNPTFITNIQKFYLLPYVSGRPVSWTTPQFSSAARSKSIVPTTTVGALNTPSSISYDVPEGFFEASTQAEADNLAEIYLSGLTAQTENIYVSADPLPTASASTVIFSHEIKVEDNPAIWAVCYDNADNLGLTVGRTLYYDTNGLFTVLDGYYSLSGVSGNFRTFYKTSAGVIVDYYSMPTSASTTVTSPTSGSLPVVTTGQSYSSSWYFYGGVVEDVMYDDVNNIHGFNENWNNPTFYSSEYVKRGMINTPVTQSSFYIYSSNTSSYSYGNAPEGWYKEIPGTFNEEPFLILSALTINLDLIQNCSNDEDNGIYVTCVDTSGNIMPSFYGVSGYINVVTSSGTTSHEFIIENNDYRVLVPLGTEYINAISSASVSSITSTNPISGITFASGSFTSCNTPTPTPTPEYDPCSCYNITFDGNITHASLTAYWTDCNGTPMSYFVPANTTYGPVCAQASSAYGQAFTVGACCDVTPTPTPTPTMTPTPSEALTCLCYYALNETGTPANVYWDDCVLGASSQTLAGGGNIRFCAVPGTPFGDSGITVVACVTQTNCTQSSDCVACS